VKDLVDLYRLESRKVKVRHVNYYREKSRAEQMAVRLNEEVKPDSIIVQFAGRHRKVAFSEMVELMPAPAADGKAPVAFAGEAKLTEAVVKVMEETPARVYFLTGHGEQAISGAPDKALNEFVLELERDNYRVETLNLMGRRVVPDDCDVLVIAGPKATFQEMEVALLREYLERNGKLLVLLRPRVMGGNAENLDHLLADYNVRILDDHLGIWEYQNQNYAHVLVTWFAAHPITDELGKAGLTCLIENVCPLMPAVLENETRAGKKLQVVSPYKAIPLLCSSKKTWGVLDFDLNSATFEPAKAMKGPLILAMAVEPRMSPLPGEVSPTSPGSTDDFRLVVIGSTKVASDEAFGKFPANRTLVMNAVSWLAEKETKLGIPPKRPGSHTLNASRSTLKAVFFITVLGMPLIGVVCGGLVWWVRHRT